MYSRGNLPPNDLFDYLENKKTFTAKVIKRKDYNAGLEQIEAEIGGLGPPPQEEKEEDNGTPSVENTVSQQCQIVQCFIVRAACSQLGTVGALPCHISFCFYYRLHLIYAVGGVDTVDNGDITLCLNSQFPLKSGREYIVLKCVLQFVLVYIHTIPSPLSFKFVRYPYLCIYLNYLLFFLFAFDRYEQNLLIIIIYGCFFFAPFL